MIEMNPQQLFHLTNKIMMDSQLFTSNQQIESQTENLNNGKDLMTFNQGSLNMSDTETYKAYKGGCNVLKRLLNDEQYPTVKESIKKQHNSISSSMKKKERDRVVEYKMIKQNIVLY